MEGDDIYRPQVTIETSSRDKNISRDTIWRRFRHFHVANIRTTQLQMLIFVVVCLVLYNLSTLFMAVERGREVDEELVVNARNVHEQKPVEIEFDVSEFGLNMKERKTRTVDSDPNISNVPEGQRERVRRARSLRKSPNVSPLKKRKPPKQPQVYHLDPALGNLTEVTLKTFDDAIQKTFDDVAMEKDPLKPFYKRVAFMNFFVQENPFNYTYHINNPDACKGEEIDLLIYVHSDPEYCARRELIRNTWGSVQHYKGVNVKIMFMIGFRDDKALQKRLIEENNVFGDLVQGSFRDNYANIRLKDILGLKWVAEHCGNSRYTMKLDDDIFVNIYKLASFLGEVMPNFHSHTIACPDLRWEDVPPRNPKSKWYLEPREYPYDSYPPFCSGMAFVMTTRMAAQMFIISTKVQPLWLDDIWLTGIVANYIDVRHHYLPFTELHRGYNLTSAFLDQNYFLILAHADFEEFAQFRKEEGIAFIPNSWDILAIEGTYSGPSVKRSSENINENASEGGGGVQVVVNGAPEQDTHAQVQVFVGQDQPTKHVNLFNWCETQMKKNKS